jgi:hypothetical protein
MYNQTPLMYACIYENVSSLSYLLRRGASIRDDLPSFSSFIKTLERYYSRKYAYRMMLLCLCIDNDIDTHPCRYLLFDDHVPDIKSIYFDRLLSQGNYSGALNMLRLYSMDLTSITMVGLSSLSKALHFVSHIKDMPYSAISLGEHIYKLDTYETSDTHHFAIALRHYGYIKRMHHKNCGRHSLYSYFINYLARRCMMLKNTYLLIALLHDNKHTMGSCDIQRCSLTHYAIKDKNLFYLYDFLFHPDVCISIPKDLNHKIINSADKPLKHLLRRRYVLQVILKHIHISQVLKNKSPLDGALFPLIISFAQRNDIPVLRYDMLKDQAQAIENIIQQVQSNEYI